MNINRNVDTESTTNVSVTAGVKGITKSYAKLVAAEKVIRAGGFEVRLVSDSRLEIRKKCKSGHQLKLEVTARERFVSFQLCLPLDFKGESKEILSILNQLNDYSRENDHSEYWIMGYMGKVYLYNILLDDGHFDQMGDVVIYLVSDLFEFAEYGLERLSGALQSDYVPASTEYSEMYR